MACWAEQPKSTVQGFTEADNTKGKGEKEKGIEQFTKICYSIFPLRLPPILISFF
jgi:hypothetical protein